MIGNSFTGSVLQKALDGTWERQKAIANNISNHETPKYKAVKVSFEDALQAEVNKIQDDLKSSREKAQAMMNVRQSEISVFKDYTTQERADGNNVNIDVENLEMARTQIQYQYLTRRMTDMFSRLRYAVSEGKK